MGTGGTAVPLQLGDQLRKWVYSPTQALAMEKDSKRLAAANGGWGYAVFNHDNATGTMTADAAKADCGQSCHVKVKNNEFIFHGYQKR